MNKPEHDDGFLRDRQTIAHRVAAANRDVSEDPTEPRSEQTWETISAMAWRPAWSIRSRRGSLRALMDWWHGH